MQVNNGGRLRGNEDLSGRRPREKNNDCKEQHTVPGVGYQVLYNIPGTRFAFSHWSLSVHNASLSGTTGNADKLSRRGFLTLKSSEEKSLLKRTRKSSAGQH